MGRGSAAAGSPFAELGLRAVLIVEGLEEGETVKVGVHVYDFVAMTIGLLSATIQLVKFFGGHLSTSQFIILLKISFNEKSVRYSKDVRRRWIISIGNARIVNENGLTNLIFRRRIGNFYEGVAYQLNWTMIDNVLLSWIQEILRVPRLSLAEHFTMGTTVSTCTRLSCTFLGFAIDPFSFCFSEGYLAIFRVCFGVFILRRSCRRVQELSLIMKRIRILSTVLDFLTFTVSNVLQVVRWASDLLLNLLLLTIRTGKSFTGPDVFL